MAHAETPRAATVELARELVLEVVEAKAASRGGITHVDVAHAVHFHGGRNQILPKPRARVCHRPGSLQAVFARGQHMNARTSR